MTLGYRSFLNKVEKAQTIKENATYLPKEEKSSHLRSQEEGLACSDLWPPWPR